MSGGVDSSVAAARLVDDGFDVVGVTLHLWDYPDETPEKSRCCAPEDIHDARLVADHLGIPHYAFDRRELFRARVVDPFVEAYLEGRTPSPCVWCNRTVKMHELFEIADRLGAAKVATGHYARIERDGEGRARLHRARDDHKDQSYFLHMLSTEQLERVSLPLGETVKDEVRAEAVARELPGADKGESQELCFVASGDYAAFVEERAQDRVRPGPIVDETGRRLGDHEGIHRYTVGQRRGLGIALGRPAFVTQIDADGTVTVGDAEDIASREARLDLGTWSDDVRFPLAATVQVRARHRGAPARVERRDDELVVAFEEPVRAVSPGQIAVAYDGDRVLGGATILSAS
ncbi:MAG TPA: tRNA 2-thiouridine(34) synthase MnmA [Polyangiaceae bacterium]|nr:tRNA 2-thiouridine(34) synthase MnmA [Polyangiaceae bacterium]